MCVALAALDAVVNVQSGAGWRTPASRFHELPPPAGRRCTVSATTTLKQGELVTSRSTCRPARATSAATHTYLKLRDRLSYAFALVSVAAALEVEGATIKRARIALGGVAHKPWRVPKAEQQLEGAAVGDAAFDQAAKALLDGAQGHGDNNFKIELARRAIRRALQQAAAGTPQSQVDKRIQ